MLTALHIENIAIIERLDIDFKDGFTVLTGETGAGKSIIIDSILLLLGSKASKDLIRTGTECGIVTACFCALDSEALFILKENGLQPDEDGNVTIFRKIGRDGRNSARINGLNVTVALLKELGAHLINVHGQHDGVLLLDSRRHLLFLDEFSKADQEKVRYRASYEKVKALHKELEEQQQKETGKEQRRAELSAYISQLDACAFKAGEYKELRIKRANLMKNEEIIEALHTAVMAVYDGEQPAARQVREALDGLVPAEKLIPEGAELIQRLTQLSAELDDLGAELGKLFDEYAADRMEPEIIENRLDELEQIKKLFGPSDQEVLQNEESFRKELEALENSEDILLKLKERYQEAHEELERHAATLTARRKKGALEMEKKLRTELSDLDMPQASFHISVEDRKNERGGIRYRIDGKDEVEFFISTNRGELPKPLIKIASGGELSRIMLSMKSILNQDSNTAVYDEIDTGVSGATAEKIGRKLRSSSTGRQVFCITHLAQIAAQADHHFKVTKKEQNGRVCSGIYELSETERIDEIARIMGGEELTETLRRSAAEILNKRKNKH
ncbi:MAG: DNA repair protein RecN [Clostridiales bacterium]|nr:MAG: DNA repair protein RecN [Clostridiales bacterium]